MKLHFNVPSLLAGAVLGAGVVATLGAADAPARPVEWEYKVVPGKVFGGDLEKNLNTAIRSGWDYVSVSEFGVEQWAVAVVRRERR